MRLTFIIDEVEEPFGIDLDPSITLEDLKSLLEIELRIPAQEQVIYFHGKHLNQAVTSTLSDCGISSDEMLELKRMHSSSSSSSAIAGGNIGNDVDRMRLQILGDPALMRQLRASNPEIADAAEKSPERFAQMMNAFQQQHRQSNLQRRQDEELLHSDPYDIDAQRRIEENIRQERVWENLQHAMEFTPESFGRVTMLYVDVQVNGHPLKAFVDSGAQMTIMSPDCAQSTGIMRLIDERFSGIARGVGTAKILGRVHSAQLKMADLHLPCSFTIMEGKGVDLLFGLDMLKRHQAIIDLSKNALIIQGRELPFLSEHELPDSAKEESEDVEKAKEQSLLERDGQKQIADTAKRAAAGNTMGNAAGSSGGENLNSEQKTKIEQLISLGATHEQALSLLRSTGWNADYAASMLFNQ